MLKLCAIGLDMCSLLTHIGFIHVQSFALIGGSYYLAMCKSTCLKMGSFRCILEMMSLSRMGVE